jgi:hypothetical protein
LEPIVGVTSTIVQAIMEGTDNAYIGESRKTKRKSPTAPFMLFVV